ncbi:MAG TPA: hypothetical protein VN699_21080 [Pirellulales bacterium]|nr:hypothetical protein [Pirellulales bacterium]
MGDEQRALHELCRRVAAGDPDARLEFSREVAPLAEVIARRWLSTATHRRAAPEKAASGPFDAAASPDAFGRVGETAVARVALRICRSLIEGFRNSRSRPSAETLVQRLSWQTELVSVAD